MLCKTFEGLVLLCLTLLSTIFQLYWWKIPKYLRKPRLVARQATDKTLSHNFASSTPRHEWN